MSVESDFRLAPGTVLADTYRIERPVGKGGMGEVYEATHARLSGRYAVKLLLREVGQADEVLRRFKQEAEITSRLRNPNIVQVIDFAQMPDGTPFMVMEFLAGHDLAAELRDVPRLPLMRAIDILEQVATGLPAAHAENIVHRDLKPANIFLTPLPGSPREQEACHPPHEGGHAAPCDYQTAPVTPPPLMSQGMSGQGPDEPAPGGALPTNRLDRYPSVMEFGQALAEASRAPGLSARSA